MVMQIWKAKQDIDDGPEFHWLAGNQMNLTIDD
jgi:hypothetical protein